MFYPRLRDAVFTILSCSPSRQAVARMCMWAQDVGLLDRSALDGSRPFADVARDAALPVRTIGSPFGEITYLPSLIEMPDITPRYARGPQPLGSSPLSWTDG